MNTWEYIKADALFRDLLPEIKNHKRKIAGTNTKGAPLNFTIEETKAINAALKKVPDLNLWRYIKADRFFVDYCPNIKNYKRKISGRSSKAQPIAFSEQEQKEIEKEARKMVREILLMSSTQ